MVIFFVYIQAVCQPPVLHNKLAGCHDILEDSQYGQPSDDYKPHPILSCCFNGATHTTHGLCVRHLTLESLGRMLIFLQILVRIIDYSMIEYCAFTHLNKTGFPPGNMLKDRFVCVTEI